MKRIILLFVLSLFLYGCSDKVCSTYSKYKPVKKSKMQGRCYF